MKPWPKAPLIYEINTWPWLAEFSRRTGGPVTLATVPDTEWDRLAELGFDVIWLMGVWERSRAGVAIANRNPALRVELHEALPDYEPGDNVGSAYCIRRYRVDRHLGGPKGLAVARAALARRGVRLILDFVPNHVAPDHRWVKECPEFLIQGEAVDRRREPGAFLRRQGRVFARGRDPFFPAWSDVLQLNAFHPGLRVAAREALEEVAGQCDGVRCDMVMLVLNEVFEQTWGKRAGKRPAGEYWEALIPAVRARHREFRFIAEAYWDRERELLGLGFDYCYDKRLYDHLLRLEAAELREHLEAGVACQERLVRFIENHDEPRALSAFGPVHARAAAIAVLTLPGARLLHEGQLEGRRRRLPVCLGRRPMEVVDADWSDFHARVLVEMRAEVFRAGEWRLCEAVGWPDNASHRNLVAWSWTHGEDRCLIVVNLSADRTQARVRLPWRDLEGWNWRLGEVLSAGIYERIGDELSSGGLHVELAGFGYHWFLVERLNDRDRSLRGPRSKPGA